MRQIGSYQPIRELGSSPQGSTWVAQHPTESGRQVLLRPGKLDSEARLTYPSIATVVETFQQDDAWWTAIEFPPATITLEERLKVTQPVDFRQALLWLNETAAALDFAASNNRFHGAVKPANLLIRSSGHVKLLGFSETPEASFAGDFRALGELAYRLLTNRDAEESTALPSECRPELGTGVDAVFEKARGEGFVSHSDFTAALAESLQHLVPIEQEEERELIPAAFLPAGLPLKQIAIGAGALLVIVLGWIFWPAADNTPPRKKEPVTTASSVPPPTTTTTSPLPDIPKELPKETFVAPPPKPIVAEIPKTLPAIKPASAITAPIDAGASLSGFQLFVRKPVAGKDGDLTIHDQPLSSGTRLQSDDRPGKGDLYCQIAGRVPARVPIEVRWIRNGELDDVQTAGTPAGTALRFSYENRVDPGKYEVQLFYGGKLRQSTHFVVE